MRWCSANQQEIKPHKVRYYLNAAIRIKQKMAEVLCLYRKVRLIKGRRRPQNKNRAMRWRLSPTIRSPAFRQLPRPPRTCRPSPADTATFVRDYQYKRPRTVGVARPASIRSPAKSTPLVKDRHRSLRFIEFLKRQIDLAREIQPGFEAEYR